MDLFSDFVSFVLSDKSISEFFNSTHNYSQVLESSWGYIIALCARGQNM